MVLIRVRAAIPGPQDIWSLSSGPLFLSAHITAQESFSASIPCSHFGNCRERNHEFRLNQVALAECQCHLTTCSLPHYPPKYWIYTVTSTLTTHFAESREMGQSAIVRCYHKLVQNSVDSGSAFYWQKGKLLVITIKFNLYLSTDDPPHATGLDSDIRKYLCKENILWCLQQLKVGQITIVPPSQIWWNSHDKHRRVFYTSHMGIHW